MENIRLHDTLKTAGNQINGDDSARKQQCVFVGHTADMREDGAPGNKLVEQNAGIYHKENGRSRTAGHFSEFLI